MTDRERKRWRQKYINLCTSWTKRAFWMKWSVFFIIIPGLLQKWKIVDTIFRKNLLELMFFNKLLHSLLYSFSFQYSYFCYYYIWGLGKWWSATDLDFHFCAQIPKLSFSWNGFIVLKNCLSDCLSRINYLIVLRIVGNNFLL